LYGYVPSSSLLASVKIVADTEENNNRTQLVSLREGGDSFVLSIVLRTIRTSLFGAHRRNDTRSRVVTFAAWMHRSIHDVRNVESIETNRDGL